MTRILVALLCLLLMASGRTRPALPFPDNPDANQCGLPVLLNARGTVTGTYQGRVYEQVVRLYDSHARQHVVALVPRNTPAHALLMVSGPRLNYVLVRLQVNAHTVEGWLPEPYFTSGHPEATGEVRLKTTGGLNGLTLNPRPGDSR